MDIVICKNKEQAAHMVAGLIDRAIRANPATVLGLATGATPVLMYKDLIRRHRDESLDFSKVRSWNLDEYVGLKPSHPASYRFFMNDQLFDHINIDKAKTHVPDGLAQDHREHVSSRRGLTMRVSSSAASLKMSRHAPSPWA